MLNSTRWLPSILMLSVILLPAAWADTVTLKDGSVREGKITQEDVLSVTIEIQFGSLLGRVRILREDIASIARKPQPVNDIFVKASKLETSAKSKTGAEAAAVWVELGDFYATQNGYSSKATEAYKKALASHADHAPAHKRLGHVKTKNGWQAIDDERRARGLVPLNKAWVKPGERAWLIDKKHQQQFDDLRIGPRVDRPLNEKEIKDQLRLKQEEEEFAKRDRLNLRSGVSLLSRYGYYQPNNQGWYVASSQTPYYLDGVGISSGDSSFFVGRVGAGYYPYDSVRYGERNGIYPGSYFAPGYRHSRLSHGISPGLIYRRGNTRLGFGSSYSNYGSYSGYGGSGYSHSSHSSYGSGFGFSLHGGSKNFSYGLHFGGGGSHGHGRGHGHSRLRR